MKERIPELPGNRLGRHIGHDPRSRNYPYRIRKAGELKTVQHKRVIPVLNQEDIGSCTGMAAIGCLGTEPFYSGLPASLRPSVLSETAEMSAEKVYSDATRLDSYPGVWPPEDTGSDGVSVAKACQNMGLISGYTWAFSLESALQALTQQPVIMGINWYSSFDLPSPDGMIVVDPGAFVRGGHELVFDAINVDAQTVGFTNSWGSWWGKSGTGWMTWGTLDRLLQENGDVTVFTPLPVAPEPKPERREGCLPGSMQRLFIRRYE